MFTLAANAFTLASKQAATPKTAVKRRLRLMRKSSFLDGFADINPDIRLVFARCYRQIVVVAHCLVQVG
jgi:hypothetical protein